MSPTATARSPVTRSALERTVLAYIRRESLLAEGDLVLVALSGGPDSVALLSLLAALASPLRLSLHAVHFNYRLRGVESDGDAAFVRVLCDRMGIPLTTEVLSVTPEASAGRMSSLQMQARIARYERLATLAERLSANRVALGHTADDQAETICMWLLRGTGLEGLTGIPPSRDGRFVRPLLEVSRDQVLAYLAKRGLASRTDSSNAKAIYLRNRIRREVLPMLKRENPSLLATWRQQTDLMREEHRYLEDQAAQAWRRVRVETGAPWLSLSRAGLQGLPLALQRRVVRMALREARGDVYGASFRVVESIVRLAGASSAGRRVICRGVKIDVQGDALRMYGGAALAHCDATQPAAGKDTIPVSIPSTVHWLAGNCVMSLSLALEPEALHPGRSERSETAARLDADRFSPELNWRSWRAGDRFCPAGLGGHQQKLQDFFTNLKVPRPLRRQIPLLVAPEGILWVAGYRADERFVAREDTRRVLRVVVGAGGAGRQTWPN